MTATINKSNLSNFILSEMNKKGWSLRKTALSIGVSASYLSNLVNKKADSNPKPSTLNKIAEGLHVDKQPVYDAAGQVLMKDYDDDDAIAFLRKARKPNEEYDPFDIGKAIDNDQYMTNHGKPLNSRQKAMLKALFGE